MALSRVGVLGAGQMGNGIAQVCAAHGLKVRMVDIHQPRWIRVWPPLLRVVIA